VSETTLNEPHFERPRRPTDLASAHAQDKDSDGLKDCACVRARVCV